MRRLAPLIAIGIGLLVILPLLRGSHGKGLSSAERATRTKHALALIDRAEVAYRTEHRRYTDHLADLIVGSKGLASDLAVRPPRRQLERPCLCRAGRERRPQPRAGPDRNEGHRQQLRGPQALVRREVRHLARRAASLSLQCRTPNGRSRTCSGGKRIARAPLRPPRGGGRRGEPAGSHMPTPRVGLEPTTLRLTERSFRVQ
jgi:hypothetical protein